MSEPGSRTGLRRAVLEALIIIASILAAFSLDAWWDRLKEANEVAEDLENIAVEAESNREAVETEVALLRRIHAGGTAVLEVLEANPGASVVEVPDTLAFLVITSPTLDLSMGAIDALVASGRLGRVDEPALRLLLSGFREYVRDAVEEERRAGQLFDNAPEVVMGSDLRNAFRVAADFWQADNPLGNERPLRSYGSSEISNSPVSRNVMRIRMNLFLSAIIEMEDLNESLAEIHALITSRPRDGR